MTALPEKEERDRLRQFYLGRLPVAEAEHVVRRVTSDDDYDELADQEADALVIAYREDTLSPVERLTVNGLLTIPEWRHRLDVLDGLSRVASRQAPQSPETLATAQTATTRWHVPAWVGVAAAVVAVAGLGLWQQERRAVGRQRTAAAALQRQIDSMSVVLDSTRVLSERLQLALAPVRTVPWALFPGSELLGRPSRVVPDSATFIRLQMVVEGELPPGRLLVRISRARDELLRAVVPESQVRRSEGLAELTVSRALFPSEDLDVSLFVVHATGREEVLGSYVLRLRRR